MLVFELLLFTKKPILWCMKRQNLYLRTLNHLIDRPRTLEIKKPTKALLQPNKLKDVHEDPYERTFS